MVAGIPSGQLALPDDIAKAAVFLASDEAAYMHGSTLLIDGGALSTRLA
jgi:3-oxoacyl-[acyl-carrier protein] reductase